jgi:hypothetical protein
MLQNTKIALFGLLKTAPYQIHHFIDKVITASFVVCCDIPSWSNITGKPFDDSQKAWKNFRIAIKFLS